MNPATMARNAAHLEGGTFREYSPEQWLEATLFWQRHARVVPELDPSPKSQIVEILYAGGFRQSYIPEFQADYVYEAAAQIEAIFRPGPRGVEVS